MRALDGKCRYRMLGEDCTKVKSRLASSSGPSRPRLAPALGIVASAIALTPDMLCPEHV